MKSRLVASLGPISAVLLVCTVAPGVRADDSAPSPETDARIDNDARALEDTVRDAIHTRRVLADAVLGAGLLSIAGGAALTVPTADDLAWRFAGINTLVFGVADTVIGLLALRGIAREEESFEAPSATASRRTPHGLDAARVHAALDERRESVGHAVNLGLDFGYLAVGIGMGVGSQLGVDHPNRWLASSIAVGVESIFLIGVDAIGLSRSKGYHETFVKSLAPTLDWTGGRALQLGVRASFL